MEATLSPTAQRAGYMVKRLQQAIRVEMEHRMAGLELGMSGYAALAHLRDAPGLSSAELARRCFVTPQTMGGVVALLEERGLLTRVDAEGRAQRLDLTPAGTEALTSADQVVEAVHEEMLEGFSADEHQLLKRLLTRAIDNIEDATSR